MNKPVIDKDKESPSLDDVIGAMERLMRLFQMERILYLIFGIASLVLFVFAAYRVFLGQCRHRNGIKPIGHH